MTVPTNDNQVQEKSNDKEYNFRALEQRYQKQLEVERNARLEAERMVQESRRNSDDDDNDDEPYVDRKRLDKKLAKFGEQTQQQTQSEIQKAVQSAIKDERKQNWLKTNSDFYEVLKHADKFAEKDPELAETILEMPEGFERQKLVYKSIKALGIHNPEPKQQTIQDKVDANRRGSFYQPSGVGQAPFSNAGDFSLNGQKNAYEKMKELKSRFGG